MLTVALAKGRTAEGLLPLSQAAGIPLTAELLGSRLLVVTLETDPFGQIRCLLAKPMDVPIYVSYGVADLGIVGKDVLLERTLDVYELLDLGISRCQLCVAGKPESHKVPPKRVATKYPRLAEAYFRQKCQSVEIVQLSGSIELAPVMGLTDRIFDLVQTGGTLAANGLTVLDTVHEISARLVANRSSYRLKRAQIEPFLRAMSAAANNQEADDLCAYGV